MSDWRDDEFGDNEFDDRPAPAGEGVRIMGAGAGDDAQWADPAAGQYADPQYTDPQQAGGQYADPQYADPDATGRFPLPGEGEAWPTEVGGWEDPAAPGASPELQHWTEPATGEVPSVLGGGGGTGNADDFDSWSSLPGSSLPRR